MKKKSIIDLSPPSVTEDTLFYIWKGSKTELYELIHSPESEAQLHNVLGTRRQARIWCPNDGDKVITVVVRNKGTIVSS